MGDKKKEAKPENFERSLSRFGIIGTFIICVLLDVIGCLSYLFPVLELTDVAWAPISAYLLFALLGSTLGSVVNLFEEILPGFDIIPTATIMFFVCLVQHKRRKEKKQ